MMRIRDRFDRSKRKPSTRNQRLDIAIFWFSLRIAWLFGSPKAPAVVRERFVSELEAM
jgi:hypothetical protein